MLSKDQLDTDAPNLCNNTSATMLSKQLKLLFERRKNMQLKYHQQKQRHFAISAVRSEIVCQHGKLTYKQAEIDGIKQVIDQLTTQLAILEQEKLETVISIENREARLGFLSQSLIQHYKPTISELDNLRLKLIQLESGCAIRQTDPAFSIRRAIVLFLKDHGLVKPHYKWGIQLQISLNGRAEEFRWFAIELLKQCRHPDQANIIQHIHQYTALLTSAQELVRAQSLTPPSMVVSTDRGQLTQQIALQRESLAHMYLQLKETSKKCKDIEDRVSELAKLADIRQSEKNETRLKLEVLRQKVIYIEATFNTLNEAEDFGAQLAQIDEAIEYFQLKQVGSSKAKSSILIDSGVGELYSPSSSTSLPAFTDSMTQSHFAKSPTSHALMTRSKKTGQKFGRVGSPMKWK